MDWRGLYPLVLPQGPADDWPARQLPSFKLVSRVLRDAGLTARPAARGRMAEIGSWCADIFFTALAVREGVARAKVAYVHCGAGGLAAQYQLYEEGGPNEEAWLAVLGCFLLGGYLVALRSVVQACHLQWYYQVDAPEPESDS